MLISSNNPSIYFLQRHNNILAIREELISKRGTAGSVFHHQNSNKHSFAKVLLNAVVTEG